VEKQGIGSIGITRINSHDQLNQEIIDSASLIKDLATPDIKLGALQLNSIILQDGSESVGVIGVTAYSDENKQWHYFAIAFTILNPYSFQEDGIKHTPMKGIGDVGEIIVPNPFI